MIMRRLLFLTSLCLILPSLACQSQGRSRLSSVESPLALDRVVLYQNGIAYFERRGKLSGDRLMSDDRLLLRTRSKLYSIRGEAEAGKGP